MHWSVAWFITPVLLLVVRDQMRADADRRRDIAKTSALSNEKDVILARIDDLPAWVSFQQNSKKYVYQNFIYFFLLRYIFLTSNE